MPIPFVFFFGEFRGLFEILLIVAAVLIARSVFRGVRSYRREPRPGELNSSPLLAVPAAVTAKTIRRGFNGDAYFASFEVESGDKLIFELHPAVFSRLKENETGKLHFRGDEFVKFVPNDRVVEN